MSDLDPVRAVLAVFPQVTEAAERYKIAEPDRESRGLARGIANERTLFDQTAQRILLFSPSSASSSSHDDNAWLPCLENELGRETAAQVLHDLQTLTEQLQILKTELVSAGRAKGVLDKIRGKASGSARGPPKNPRTRLQKRLDVVSNTNELLASRLSFGHTLLSRASQPPNATGIIDVLDGVSRSALVAFDTFKRDFTCHCYDSHIVYLECPGIAEGLSSGQAMKANHAQPLKFFIQPSTESPNQDSACSFNSLASEQDIASISPLEDWMHLQGADLDWKRRIELALQLSLAVVHLSPTPWIDDSWTWDSWAIAADPMTSYEPLFGRPLLFRHRFGSSTAPNNPRPPSSTVWSILSRGPALGRLGLCLLELAFGHSISEIRRDGAGKDHFDLRTGCDDELDVDVLDFVAAKQLLVSRTIRHKFGEPFEDAVRACIHQQFRVGKSGDIVELDRRDPLFLQKATISIISPLWLQLDRYIRAEHRDTVPNKKSLAKVTVEGVRKEDLKLANRQDVVDSLTQEILAQDMSKLLPEKPELLVGQASSYSRVDKNSRAVAHQDSCLHEPTLPEGRPAEPCSAMGGSSNSLPSVVRSAAAGHAQDRERSRAAGPDSERHGLRLPSLSNESLEDSEWAYDSATGTTESVQTWVADTLDEPPEDSGHPVLSSIKHLVLRVTLHNFHAWNERSPGPARGTAGATIPRESGQPKKRGRHQPGRGVGQDKNGDDDDDDEIENAWARKRQRPDEANMTLACPFYKKDRRLNGSCCGKRLSRIRDVKQHLKRRHYMPIYCPICYKNFLDETKRDNHTNEMACERGTYPRPVGISQKQQGELSKRALRQHTEEEQWYGIFDILFPDHPRPDSAYIDASLMASAMAYQEFVTARGLEILHNVLTASGAISWNVPPGQDLETFQRQILGEGLAAISDEWAREGAISPQAAAEAAHSAEGDPLGVMSSGSISQHHGSAMDADAASSSSVLQASSLSSIAGSSEYAHSYHEPCWPYESHQHENLFHDWDVANILGEEGVREIQGVVSRAALPDHSLEWQHEGHVGHYRNR
ncbi:Het and ankyrin domain protein [Colletotrichum higginsianum IMI 349063]|uniref:Het and ankyrin domain protein n=2 Tax=Colletotrichum higginsianum (strain IMI 349063) TaxID=759273 RepID=A0A1B7YJJ9_COLHI|nr:Het and ankyrin domain protein [Colletotrichum higginsianum IMI 349063]OBR12200.1 Het and ankyrin domain protein [Colletotrichum higginsianum IMI 349063]